VLVSRVQILFEGAFDQNWLLSDQGNARPEVFKRHFDDALVVKQNSPFCRLN
jgi:hypothetical protein